MRKLLLVLTILSIQQGIAQSQDAWVFFADKENVEVSLADPILIMTQEAIDRKELHGTAIDERDVPVNENYITQIKNATGITVRSKSKWMNCVYVIGSQPNIESLLDLSFVTNVEYADKSLNLFPGAPIEKKFSLKKHIDKLNEMYDHIKRNE